MFDLVMMNATTPFARSRLILDPQLLDLVAQGGSGDLEGLGSAGDVPLEAL
jgi:hypothetical protein